MLPKPVAKPIAALNLKLSKIDIVQANKKTRKGIWVPLRVFFVIFNNYDRKSTQHFDLQVVVIIGAALLVLNLQYLQQIQKIILSLL